MHYTTILHGPRKQFDLSCNEYCIADMIQRLSANPKAPVLGWCNQSRGNMAEDMGLSKRSVIDIIKTLIEKKLVEKNPTDMLRTTSLWYDAIHDARNLIKAPHADSAPPMQKVHPEGGAESSPPVQNLHGGSAENSPVEGAETSPPPHADSAPNKESIRDNNKEDNKTNNSKKEREGANALSLSADEEIKRLKEANELLEAGIRAKAAQEEEVRLAAEAAKIKAAAAKAEREAKKVPSHPFKESVYYSQQAFVSALVGTDYDIYDLPWYHETVKNWADSKMIYKTDWLSTARGFMLRDAKKGEARLKKGLTPVANGNPSNARPVRQTDAEFANSIDAHADWKYRGAGRFAAERDGADTPF